MTKEDLIRLREEIRGLSEEELFERDIYLRDLVWSALNTILYIIEL